MSDLIPKIFKRTMHVPNKLHVPEQPIKGLLMALHPINDSIDSRMRYSLLRPQHIQDCIAHTGFNIYTCMFAE
jgi:hypothetical protein